MPLVLASSSPIRRAMLGDAGIAFERIPSEIDEEPEKARHDDPRELTLALSQAKALEVSRRCADAWVIGSDSVVSVDGRIFGKPAGRAQAAEHLRLFSGKGMILTSAVALARNGVIDWSLADSALLKVRDLSDQFIDDYLAAEWPEIGYCVGVFRLEGRGVQLFESIEGSYFTILGMPLLPLLSALRQRGLVAK